jgi:hypothetical protein
LLVANAAATPRAGRQVALPVALLLQELCGLSQRSEALRCLGEVPGNVCEGEGNAAASADDTQRRQRLSHDPAGV